MLLLLEIKHCWVNDSVGEIVITHNKAIKVKLLRENLADMGSTCQQGDGGLRSFVPLLPAAQGRWSSTGKESAGNM